MIFVSDYAPISKVVFLIFEKDEHVFFSENVVNTDTVK